MASSSGKPFAEQLAERTAPYMEQVVVKTFESVNQRLDDYFTNLPDYDNLNKFLEDAKHTLDSNKDSSESKSITSRLDEIQSSLSDLKEVQDAHEFDVEEKFKSTEQDFVNGANSEESTVEKSVLVKPGQEDKPVTTGKVSVLNLVYDVSKSLGKLVDDNKDSEESVKEVAENFSKPVKSLAKYTSDSFASVNKTLDTIKGKLKNADSFFQKILKVLGIVFIGFAFKDRIVQAFKDAFPGLASLGSDLKRGEKYGKGVNRYFNRISADVEEEVLGMPLADVQKEKHKLDDHPMAKPSRFDYESREEFVEAKEKYERWKDRKTVIDAVVEDPYKYHPELIPEGITGDLDESTVKADLWALGNPLTAGEEALSGGLTGPGKGPLELETSEGVIYSQFAQTSEAQAIRDKYATASGTSAYGDFEGTYKNPSFKKEFKEAFEEFMRPYLETYGTKAAVASVFVNQINNNQSPINQY